MEPINWHNLGCSRIVEGVEVATIKGFECIVQVLLNIAMTVAGIAVLVMFLTGGIKYLTSGADPKAKQMAENTLTYAVLGVFVMIAAWFILRLISQFTGVDVTIFRIPGP